MESVGLLAKAGLVYINLKEQGSGKLCGVQSKGNTRKRWGSHIRLHIYCDSAGCFWKDKLMLALWPPQASWSNTVDAEQRYLRVAEPNSQLVHYSSLPHLIS